MKQVIKYIINKILMFFSIFIYKDRKKIFCLPDYACKANCVDIINYTADNMLSFLNYLLKHYENEKLTIFLIYFDKQRIHEYISYVDSFHNKSIQIKFLYLNYQWRRVYKQSLVDTYRYYFSFFQSKFVLTSDVVKRFPYKRNSQTYISLNYFTPFKLDKLNIDPSTKVEYVISTSQLASQIISGSCKVPIDNFRVLGFSRNDNILHPRYSREELIRMLGLEYVIRKIIIYTPTHRDYEYNINSKRNILGYEGTYDEFNKLLETEKVILIVKFHPGQNIDCLIGLDQPRLFVYKANYQYTLYDILPHADIMITDYTSTYFDFLLTQRPVIFNFFDREIYEKTRGFSYDPIEAVCAGPIVKTKDIFFEAIKEALSGKDEYINHRKFINSIMNKYTDENSSERIFNFCKTVFNQ